MREMPRFREEVLNVRLADILTDDYGIGAQPETKKTTKSGRSLPDVMLVQRGIKINLEGRLENSPQIKNLEAHCTGRVEKGIADVAIGVTYPKGTDEADDAKQLVEKLKTSRYDCMTVFMSSDGTKTIKVKGSSLNDLVGNILAACSIVVKNDIVRSKVTEVDQAINEASKDALEHNMFFSSDQLLIKLKELMGLED
jgi:hypothetical protein